MVSAVSRLHIIYAVASASPWSSEKEVTSFLHKDFILIIIISNTSKWFRRATIRQLLSIFFSVSKKSSVRKI